MIVYEVDVIVLIFKFRVLYLLIAYQISIIFSKGNHIMKRNSIKFGKKCTKITVALVLSLCMAFTALPSVAAATAPEASGGIGTFLLGEVKAWGVSYAKKGLIATVNAAGESINADKEIVNFIDTLIKGPSGSTASSTLATCTKILADVEQIKQEINAMNISINNGLEKIQDQLNKQALDHKQQQIKKIENIIAADYESYTKLINAENEVATLYSQLASDEELKAAQDKVDQQLYNMGWYKKDGSSNYTINVDGMKKTLANHKEQCIQLATIISPYTVSTTPNAVRTPGELLSSKTLLDCAYDACIKCCGTEAECFDFMSDNINCGIAPFSLMLTYDKMATDFLATYANMNNDKDSVNKAKQIYADIYNMSTNAINETLNQYKPFMDSLMRSYDVNQTVEMKYKSSGDVKVQTALVNVLPHEEETTYTKSTAKTTHPNMNAYVVKPMGCATPYLYMDTYEMTVGDLFDGWRYRTSNKSDTAWYPTQDFYNILSTKDGKYKLPTNGSEYDLISSSNSFGLLGRSTGSMYSYLHSINGLSSAMLPSTNYYSDMPVNNITWDYVGYMQVDADNQADFCNVSGWSNSNGKELTNSKKIEQLINNTSTPIIMLKANSDSLSYKMDYSSNGNGSINVYTTLDSSVQDGKNQYSVSNPIESGASIEKQTMLYVAVKPDEGYSLESLDLVSKNGNVMCQLADNNNMVNQQITTDGSYVFQVPMTYQDCSIKASFVKDNPKYTVSPIVYNAEDTDVYFTNSNNLRVNQFTENETVTVNADPINDKSCYSVTILNETNQPVETIAMENNKASFTMPNYSCSIKCVYKDNQNQSYSQLIPDDMVNIQFTQDSDVTEKLLDNSAQTDITFTVKDQDKYLLDTVVVENMAGEKLAEYTVDELSGNEAEGYSKTFNFTQDVVISATAKIKYVNISLRNKNVMQNDRCYINFADDENIVFKTVINGDTVKLKMTTAPDSEIKITGLNIFTPNNELIKEVSATDFVENTYDLTVDRDIIVEPKTQQADLCSVELLADNSSYRMGFCDYSESIKYLQKGEKVDVSITPSVICEVEKIEVFDSNGTVVQTINPQDINDNRFSVDVTTDVFVKAYTTMLNESINVAGEAGLCGTAWDLTANYMYPNTGGDMSIIIHNVPAGTYAWKIVQNGDWFNAYNENGAINNSDNPFNASITLDKTDAVIITFYPNGTDDNPQPHAYAHSTSRVDITDHTYTVAGSAELCGNSWDASDTTNNMTQLSENVYSITYNSVPKGDYEFKIAEDYSWGRSWGDSTRENGNALVSVAEDDSKVTILLDLETNKITTQVTPNKHIVYGDLNGDGLVTIKDTVIVQNAIVTDINSVLTNDQMIAGDVNGDGVISLLDALLIQNYVTDMIDVFPVEE